MPDAEDKDFYEMDIASGSITRGFMAKPCDMYFTLDRKLRRYLDCCLKLYNVPTEKRNSLIEAVLAVDLNSVAAKLIEEIVAKAETGLEEAIELRENNIKMPILCLGFVPEESLEYALENNITLTIYSLEMAKKLNDISEKTGITANIHIKIDTGMSRIGFEASEESIDQIVNISNLNNLYIEGIYTHLSLIHISEPTRPY